MKQTRSLPLRFLFAFLGILMPMYAGAQANVEAGRQLTFDPRKGNCLDCHQFPSDARATTRATVGPALANIKPRFPDRAALTALIKDASIRNADTVMPPYGKHRILTDHEIDAVVAYLLTQ
jgi:L-cysteine S-thiosulfotransferase